MVTINTAKVSEEDNASRNSRKLVATRARSRDRMEDTRAAVVLLCHAPPGDVVPSPLLAAAGLCKRRIQRHFLALRHIAGLPERVALFVEKEPKDSENSPPRLVPGSVNASSSSKQRVHTSMYTRATFHRNTSVSMQSCSLVPFLGSQATEIERRGTAQRKANSLK